MLHGDEITGEDEEGGVGIVGSIVDNVSGIVEFSVVLVLGRVVGIGCG